MDNVIIRKAIPGDEQVYAMETTYYDTPSGVLSQRHITLRCRMENEEAVCTVKTPLDGYGRGEWDCSCSDIVKAIPLLVEAGADGALIDLTAEGVIPVCGARFTRHCGSIEFAGSVLEIALDQGVLTGGSKEQPLCEVEVELKFGYRQEVEIMGLLLKEAYGLTAENRSKYQRSRELGAK